MDTTWWCLTEAGNHYCAGSLRQLKSWHHEGRIPPSARVGLSTGNEPPKLSHFEHWHTAFPAHQISVLPQPQPSASSGRLTGVVIQWNQAGYGFISPWVYVHASQLPAGVRDLRVDDVVVYEAAPDRFGNPQGAATKVEVLVKKKRKCRPRSKRERSADQPVSLGRKRVGSLNDSDRENLSN